MATPHRTIDRVAAILEAAAAESDQGITLASITRELDAPKSSIHGLISGLLSVGYLVERDGRYVLGPGLGVLLAGTEERALSDAARDELRRLNEDTEETVLLGVRVGNAVVYTDQIESRHPIRYTAPTHVRRPMLTTSMGKLFLSELDERQVRRIAQSSQTGEPIDLDALLAELAEVRSRGYSVNYLSMQDGITALASGIRDRRGKLTAAIAVRGPSFRMSSEKVEYCAQLLEEAADRISALLARGGRA
jgi:DNA-binding IclR family transcriptional regulator